MQLGLRPKTKLADTYKEFHIIRIHGRFHGIPPHLDPEIVQMQDRLGTHPAIMRAATEDDLKALIDTQENQLQLPEIQDSYAGYDIISHRNAVFAIPREAGSVDLDLEDECLYAGAFRAPTIPALRERIDAIKAAIPVEFAGWMPIFATMGNCGKHPQFTHTATPPLGYRFTRSALPEKTASAPRWWHLSSMVRRIGDASRGLFVSIRPLFTFFGWQQGASLIGRILLVAAIVKLFFTLRQGGGSILPILRFIRSRHFKSQLMLSKYRGLVFLTSAPFTCNQNPWVIEIEDPTTLFNPFIHNGQTSYLDIGKSPYLPIVKALLESHQCKGILTHMRSTARMLPTLFQSETIARKITYVPLGVNIPARWQQHDRNDPDCINVLYINSWCQLPGNFHVRGGLDVLEAFAILQERYPQLRLTMRTGLPPLDNHYHRIMESSWVRVINRFLSTDEMEQLHAESHIFLLPAARVHIVSLLQAMAAGLAVVASDGWGMQEYLTHERNGLVVPGRYGKTSWVDEEAGLLREDYVPTHTTDPIVVQGIVDAVSRLVEDHELRRRLGQTARHDVETTYNLKSWNDGLKSALDKAVAAP
jgi:glycosyltransferase involved in cell wall biosynthesis